MCDCLIFHVGTEGHAERSLRYVLSEEMAAHLSELGQTVSAGIHLWGLLDHWWNKPGGRVAEGTRVFFVENRRIRLGGRAAKCFEFTPEQSSYLWPTKKFKPGYYRDVFEVEDLRVHDLPLRALPAVDWFEDHLGPNVLKRRRLHLDAFSLASIES